MEPESSGSGVLDAGGTVHGAATPGAAPSSTPPLEWVAAYAVLVRYRAVTTTVIVCAFLAALILLLLPREWASTVEFTPVGSSSRLGGLAAELGFSPAGDQSQAPDFYVDLLQTDDLLGGVARRRYAISAEDSGHTESLAALLAIRGEPGPLVTDKVVRALRKRLAVSIGRRTGIVMVKVTAPSKVVARDVARELVAAVTAFNIRTRQSRAAAERRFVEDRLTNVRAELSGAENTLRDFVERNRQYANSPQLMLEFERLNRVVNQRQLVFTSLLQSYEQARIDEVRDTPVITVVQEPILPVRPEPRGTILKTLLAVVIGFLGALVWAVAKEWQSARALGASTIRIEVSRLLSVRLRSMMGVLTRLNRRALHTAEGPRKPS